MDRRSFLSAATKPQSTAHQAVGRRQLSTGLAPYSGPWTADEVAHLLKRTLFGFKVADLEYFKGLTVSQAVDELLTPTATAPAPPLKDYDNSNITANDADLQIPIGQTWVDKGTLDGTAESRRRDSLRAWWMGQIISQDRSVQEKMTLFWHNHFVTASNDAGTARAAYSYNTLLREQCLGNLKQLTRAITLNTAMLTFLNGRYNTSGAPDENFARELQELFTLGKENQPNYTEADVKTVARVLTGWRVKDDDNTVFFEPRFHDTKDKVFSSFYGNRVITGRSGADAGDLELDELIDMIFSKDRELSRFLVTKIYRWFVYYEIDDNTRANVIEPLAQLLRDSNWEVKPVLSALLKSEHFFDMLNRGCQIKSPVDFIAGFCRELELTFPPEADTVNLYGLWRLLVSFGYLLQQTLCDPPDVSGWKAYYQAPNFYEIWINSDTYPKRNQFTDLLVVMGYTQGGFNLKVDPIAIARRMSNPSDPNALLDDVLRLMYRVPLSDTAKAQIKKDILLSGQASDYYWTNAWNAHIAAPNDAMATSLVQNRLRDLLKYLMNQAEYHLA
jgi:uncharacterized protein (DUF1800 family)